MNLGEIVETAIGQVVSTTETQKLVNVNKKFVALMANKGYHIVERSALWKFSEKEAVIPFTSGEASVAAPNDFGVPVMAQVTESRQPLEYHDERQRFLNLGSGTPQAYGIWGDDLRVYPTPNKAGSITLRYYGTWPDLREDSDVPVIPETFHDLLVDYASYHLALRLPATGERFLPFSAAQPYIEAFTTNLGLMLDSDLVLKTFDEVPNYDFIENVLGMGEW